jgi:hypothetical protein
MLPIPMSQEFLPTFPYSNLTCSSLIFKSLIYLKFIFVYGVRRRADFILLHVSSFLNTICWKMFFSHCVFLVPLSKFSWVQMCRFTSGFSIMLHWWMYLFLCCFNYICFIICLEIRVCNVTIFVLLLKIDLAIQGLLWFNTNLSTFSVSKKMALQFC